jgi:hypothetical protein
MDLQRGSGDTPGAVLKNCVVMVEGTPTQGRAIMRTTGQGANPVTLDHVTLVVKHPEHGFEVGVGPGSYTATRCVITDCIDAFRASAANVKIEGCYVGSPVVLDPDPWGYYPATHTDGIQMEAITAGTETNWEFTGNWVDMTELSGGSNVPLGDLTGNTPVNTDVSFTALMRSGSGSLTSAAFKAEKNWFSGARIQFNGLDADLTGKCHLTGNRWEKGSANGGPANLMPFVAAFVSTAMDAEWADNTYRTGGDLQVITQ